MTKGERTRREIVEKAAPLFNQKGYEGTCLSDLMEATGLKKGGIYRHFSSRAALASEAFDCARRQAASGRLGRVDAVENHVHRLKKRIVAGGCPLMNTAVESDDGNAALRAGARKAAKLDGTAGGNHREGIEKNEIDVRVDPKKLSRLIIGSLEGALLIGRFENDEEPLRDIRQHLDDYLDRNVRARNPALPHAHNKGRSRRARSGTENRS
jgi:TetR/AcrR family transcriptional repressor of nem operon